ncbi:hypothetical protein HanIR_Chr10g0496751 [Helianthus annuus]|nr:hypothetical protein HanIR_Chr10g0496751 [Helianthus annuus]
MYTESLFVGISMGRRNADWLLITWRGLSIITKKRRFEDRVKSEGCTGRTSHII